MKWNEISIHTTNEAVEAICNILHEAGASGVVIEDPLELTKERENWFGEIIELNPDDYPEEGVIIKAYLPINSFIGETINSIKQEISDLTHYDIDIGKNHVSTTEVKEEDWEQAWKQYYHPAKISRRFTIVPTWEDYQKVSSDELIIELDPGMAFGTGTHPTTVMSIQALEKIIKAGDTVVDVGTGSGVLSIAAALLNAKNVIALDLDEIAVESAEQNIALNQLQEKIEVRKGDLLNGLEIDNVDVIVANILADVIIRLTKDAASLVRKNGYFITSGIIQPKKQEVQTALIQGGFEITETLVMEDWVTFIARRT
ncbi:50S ribosomal protein L11 methyltransferase [Lederbergia sp. NSJ-179]|uniref:50S ribosomal protein L11 methyltransferase n=1 Tax=Lederbergia sp. NSJ-179 TaxID=2931402 RepID=UPI001FD565CF|nr:50S ribosomal protein L11 methyltransferase [Lederbergia sp. NSJ-179]MCJ7841826.1 50S ribosomal protein L11 methyltransferase [Lederbergia sp. NSJ-179]